MKNNYLIGLGGSGGKVIARLYKQLLKQRGPKFMEQVACIAIDTDQDELDDLSALGVEQVCISGSETVGQLIDRLSPQVLEWCPAEAEGEFTYSLVDNGASQCRLKSRLCFANYLRNENNALKQALEQAQTIDSNSANKDAAPKVLIVSSIAGGTGSGIFIQVALYIKRFFHEHNMPVRVHGLFACPDLYTEVTSEKEQQNLFSNAYAVVRELNAFNLITGSTKEELASRADIKIEMDSSGEGTLFKDAAGRSGDKPYDLMYFIDKYNYLKKIVGGLDEYYDAMANIAYSHLYTEISGEVMSAESNELRQHTLVPTAIYGSAGAATMKYPYEDIMRYLSARAIDDSIGDVWMEIDEEWRVRVDDKKEIERAAGRQYHPEPHERGEHFEKEFDRKIARGGVLSFLEPQIKRGNMQAVDAYIALIQSTLTTRLQEHEGILRQKNRYGLTEDHIAIDQKAVISGVQGSSAFGNNSNLFAKIQRTDADLFDLAKGCLAIAEEMGRNFANEIFCVNRALTHAYDKKDTALINNVLYNPLTKEWVHPLAARYMLYKLRKAVVSFNQTALTNDTTRDDLFDFEDMFSSGFINDHRKKLDQGNVENKAQGGSASKKTNEEILQEAIKGWFGAKKSTTAMVNEYYKSLRGTMQKLEDSLVAAAMYFAFQRVIGRLNALIEQYEFFFDNMEEFLLKTRTTVGSLAKKHEEALGTIYVCASQKIKEDLYEEMQRSFNVQGGELGSMISGALFNLTRTRACRELENASKRRPDAKVQHTDNVESFCDEVLDIVTEGAKNTPEINGLVNKNVFQALMFEFRKSTENGDYLFETYAEQAGSRKVVQKFVADKLAILGKLAAPMLAYNQQDLYSSAFQCLDENDRKVPKPDVSTTRRFLSHTAAVENSIRELIGNDTNEGAIAGFYSTVSSRMDTDPKSVRITLSYEQTKEEDDYTIWLYSTVHCLQPYQIDAFDELKGGKYYMHYAERLRTMNELKGGRGIESLTPHLDKRWHKHGMMPYINYEMELKCRTDLAKAFLFALANGEVYLKKRSNRIVQKMNGQPLAVEGGSFATGDTINRVLYWLLDNDNYISEFAAQFDHVVRKELELLSAYTDDIQTYERNVGTKAGFWGQMHNNILRLDMVDDSRDGGRSSKRKTQEQIEEEEKELNKKKISALMLAWLVHTSEEREYDRDYAELIVEVLCDMIRKYAQKYFRNEALAEIKKDDPEYADYIHVRNHFIRKFIKSLVNNIEKQGSDDTSDSSGADSDDNPDSPNNVDTAKTNNTDPATTNQNPSGEGTTKKKKDFDASVYKEGSGGVEEDIAMDAVSDYVEKHPAYQWAIKVLRETI